MKCPKNHINPLTYQHVNGHITSLNNPNPKVANVFYQSIQSKPYIKLKLQQ